MESELGFEANEVGVLRGQVLLLLTREEVEHFLHDLVPGLAGVLLGAELLLLEGVQHQEHFEQVLRVGEHVHQVLPRHAQDLLDGEETVETVTAVVLVHNGTHSSVTLTLDGFLSEHFLPNLFDQFAYLRMFYNAFGNVVTLEHFQTTFGQFITFCFQQLNYCRNILYKDCMLEIEYGNETFNFMFIPLIHDRIHETII